MNQFLKVVVGACAVLAAAAVPVTVHAACDPIPCTAMGDLNGDGFHSVQDVVLVVGTAFRGAPSSRYLGADDMNGDGFVTVQDVVLIVNVAFRGGTVAQNTKFHIYNLTGRLGTGRWWLVNDDSLQYRIVGVFELGSDTVAGDPDYVDACDKTDTLFICPGTIIEGDNSPTSPAFVIVRRTGYMHAVGTDIAPVVFTTMNPPGSRNKGDWGGMVINGCAPNNNAPTFIYATEGPLKAGFGGGGDPYDNSGCFVYMRIDFGGREITVNNELNGITVNSVGGSLYAPGPVIVNQGTTMEYIQVNQNADDGIEWFGGTVDVKHAIVSGIDDDGYDTDIGSVFRGQFLIVWQDTTKSTSSNHQGFEWDNQPSAAGFNYLPRNNPVMYNVTLTGQGWDFTAQPNYGAHFRRGTAGQIYNSIWTRFRRGLDIDDSASLALATIPAGGTFPGFAGTDLKVCYSCFYDINAWDADANDKNTQLPLLYDESTGNPPSMEAAFNNPGAPYFNDVVLNAGPAALPNILTATGPFDAGFPDFRPLVPNVMPCVLNAGPVPPNDGFFDQVTFKGAVEAGAAEWYKPWADFSRF